MWFPLPFVVLALLSVVLASPVAKRVTASQWTSLGCVVDGASRVLRDKIYSGPSNSPDYCVEICASKGYTIAGVQCESPPASTSPHPALFL